MTSHKDLPSALEAALSLRRLSITGFLSKPEIIFFLCHFCQQNPVSLSIGSELDTRQDRTADSRYRTLNSLPTPSSLPFPSSSSFPLCPHFLFLLLLPSLPPFLPPWGFFQSIFLSSVAQVESWFPILILFLSQISYFKFNFIDKRR